MNIQFMVRSFLVSYFSLILFSFFRGRITVLLKATSFICCLKKNKIVLFVAHFTNCHRRTELMLSLVGGSENYLFYKNLHFISSLFFYHRNFEFNKPYAGSSGIGPAADIVAFFKIISLYPELKSLCIGRVSSEGFPAINFIQVRSLIFCFEYSPTV
jgi:hypothetical protein